MIIYEIKNYINYLKIKDKKKSIIFFSEGFSSWNFIKYQFNLFLKVNLELIILHHHLMNINF